jgi:hypothetical protein
VVPQAASLISHPTHTPAGTVKVVPHTTGGPTSPVSGVTNLADPGGHPGDSGAATTSVDVDGDGLAVQRIDGTLSGSNGGDRTVSVAADIYGCVRHGSPPSQIRPMGSGNRQADVVDYTAMRIYQRTGENTGISYPLWAVVLGVIMIPALFVNIFSSVWQQSPAAVIIFLSVLAAGGILVWVLRRNVTKDEREHTRLAAIERMETERNARVSAETARQADLERLRNKYRT